MKYIYIILLIFILSCGYDRNRNENLDELKMEVMEKKDLTSYTKLSNIFDNESNYQDLLPYSLKMQDAQAGDFEFFDSYLKIKFGNKYNNNDIQKLASAEKNFLIFLLQKGTSYDDPNCKKILINYYREGKVLEKNLTKADSLYKSFGYPE